MLFSQFHSQTFNYNIIVRRMHNVSGGIAIQLLTWPNRARHAGQIPRIAGVVFCEQKMMWMMSPITCLCCQSVLVRCGPDVYLYCASTSANTSLPRQQVQILHYHLLAAWERTLLGITGVNTKGAKKGRPGLMSINSEWDDIQWNTVNTDTYRPKKTGCNTGMVEIREADMAWHWFPITRTLNS